MTCVGFESELIGHEKNQNWNLIQIIGRQGTGRVTTSEWICSVVGGGGGGVMLNLTAEITHSVVFLLL